MFNCLISAMHLRPIEEMSVSVTHAAERLLLSQVWGW